MLRAVGEIMRPVTGQEAVDLIHSLEEGEEWFGESWAQFMKYDPDEDVKLPEWDRLSKILVKHYRLFGRKALVALQLEGASERANELWRPIHAEAEGLAKNGKHGDDFWDNIAAFEHLVVHGAEYVPPPPGLPDDSLPF